MRAGLGLAALALAAALPAWMAPGAALAHGPQFHRARLVEFNRPLPAPPFSLAGPEGEVVRLEDLRGRMVLLNFWATWCPPCVREMPTLERLAQRMAGSPFVVLAVSLDAEGAAKVRPFLARLGLTFPVALDPEGRVADAYGAHDLPATFLIDPQGRVFAAAKGERDWAGPAMVEYLQEAMGRRS